MTRILLGTLLTVAAICAAYVAHSDTLEVRDSSEGHAAEVFYENSYSLNSKNQRLVETHNGVEVRITIEMRGSGPETITVEPLDPNYIAVPWTEDLHDGSSVVIQIMRAAGLS